jgi:hypothetical protein
MGREGPDRLYSSSARTLHQERRDDREDASLEEGFAEGAWVRHANAVLFHQSRRKKADFRTPGGTGKGQGFALKPDAQWEEI